MAEIRKLQLASNSQFLQKIKMAKPMENAEPTMLTRSGGVDTVSFTSTKNKPTNTATKPTESYEDILEEFRNAYGEGRSLEQAKLGIEYMNKLLACEDLPANMRADFEAQKQGYEMMLAEFENYEKMGCGEKVNDVWKEFENFISKYNNDPEGASYNAGTEYWLAYHESCMSFYQRLLQCDDLTEELKTKYNRMIQEHRSDKERIIQELNDRNGTTSRNNLLEQGLTDELIDKYFALTQNAETGKGVYLPKGMGIRYTIEQKGNSVSLRFYNHKNEQTRLVYILNGKVITDIDTTNTQKAENDTQHETVQDDKKVTGGTYKSLISMGLTPALIQRYFNAPGADIPKDHLESNIYTLKENIEVIPGSGAYITSVDELVEILKQYGVIK